MPANPDELSRLAEVREKALRNVDPCLSSFGPGQLFEIAIAVSRALLPDFEAPFRRLHAVDDFQSFYPFLLSRAGQLLMNWSSGFPHLVDRMRENAEHRPGHFGLTKHLGRLGELMTERSLPVKSRELFQNSIESHLINLINPLIAPRNKVFLHQRGLIDTCEAARILRVSTKTIARAVSQGTLSIVRSTASRSPVLFQRGEIDALNEVLQDIISSSKAASLVGLPIRALKTIADQGIIRRAEGPALEFVSGKTWFRESSIRAFIDAVAWMARLDKDTVCDRRFDVAIRRLPPGEKPWGAIVQAILNKSLAIRETKDRRPLANGNSLSSLDPGDQKPLFSRLLVDEQGLAALVDLAVAEVTNPNADCSLSYREAAVLLGVSTPTVSWLVAAGLVSVSGPYDRRLTKAAILSFNDEYMSTAEVAKHLSTHASRVRKAMADGGVNPVCALRGGMRLIWRRSDVVQHCDRMRQ